MDNQKRCSRCKNIKLLDNFVLLTNPKRGTQGRNNYCKECMKLYSKNWSTNRQEFYKQNTLRSYERSMTVGIYCKCIPKKTKYCNKCWQKKLYYENRTTYLLHQMIRNYQKYGLTLEDYNQMLAAQNGKCAICNEDQSKQKRRLSIDHNHQTGQIRGLLCINCNVGLGRLENVTWIKLAQIYLEKYKEKKVA